MKKEESPAVYALLQSLTGEWVRVDRDPAELHTHWRKMPMTRKTSRERGYTTDWNKLAAQFLRACPYSLGCWAVNIVEPATVVDHIRPLTRYRGQDVCDPAGLQSACRFHHDNVKRALELKVWLGELPEAALKLDSIWAQRLTTQRCAISVGVDGYRLWEWEQLRPLGPYPYRMTGGGVDAR
jgi:hypothetical protein